MKKAEVTALCECISHLVPNGRPRQWLISQGCGVPYHSHCNLIPFDPVIRPGSWGFLNSEIFSFKAAIFQMPVSCLSALGQVHQSLKDVLQAKDKCISQRSSLHPSTPIQEQVRKGLEVQPVPCLPTLAIWEVDVLAFCYHWGWTSHKMPGTPAFGTRGFLPTYCPPRRRDVL